MKNKVGIYRIISPSGKIYIGQSWNLDKRIKKYKILQNCQEQRKLFNSFKKYGAKVHVFDIIHELPFDIDQKTLDDYEIFYMEQYLSVGYELMNLKPGGSGGKMSEETKQLISLKQKGRKKPQPESSKKKVSQFTLKGVKVRDYDSITEAALLVGVSRNSITNCFNGRSKTSAKSIWKLI